MYTCERKRLEFWDRFFPPQVREESKHKYGSRTKIEEEFSTTRFLVKENPASNGWLWALANPIPPNIS